MATTERVFEPGIAGPVKGSTSGVAVAAGYIGEQIGTLRSGTGGGAYTIRATTAITSTTNPGDSVIAQTLNKGSYFLSFAGAFQQASGTTRTCYFVVQIGGTTVTSQRLIDTTNNVAVLASFALPIFISADSTVVDIKAYWSGAATSSVNNWEMSIHRIA